MKPPNILDTTYYTHYQYRAISIPWNIGPVNREAVKVHTQTQPTHCCHVTNSLLLCYLLTVAMLPTHALLLCYQLTVAMNWMILTNMEMGMFLGNTPRCLGNSVSTTALRSLCEEPLKGADTIELAYAHTVELHTVDYVHTVCTYVYVCKYMCNMHLIYAQAHTYTLITLGINTIYEWQYNLHVGNAATLSINVLLSDNRKSKSKLKHIRTYVCILPNTGPDH